MEEPAEKKAKTDAAWVATKECAICVEDLTLKEFQGQMSADCKHERNVCRSCVARTIKLEVTGKGNSTEILCPQKDCAAKLDFADIKREATEDIFERYDNLLLKEALQAEPNFRWCAHEGCGSGQIVWDIAAADRGHNRFLRCHECQQRTCAYHKCKWHTERTCQQYDEDARRSDEVGLLQYFESADVKRCTQCGHAVEKNGGCDHMTCQKRAGGCGFEFCFRCLAPYRGVDGIIARGNSVHLRSCPWYFPDPAAGGDGHPDPADGGDGSDHDNDDDYDDRNVAQLKDLLRARSLKVGGRRAELIQRLRDYNERDQ